MAERWKDRSDSGTPPNVISAYPPKTEPTMKGVCAREKNPLLSVK